MYDFKTFAQMNLDLIFQGFDRMPQPGEEVFAKRFTMQLGGGPIVCPIVLEQLGADDAYDAEKEAAQEEAAGEAEAEQAGEGA